MSCVFHKYQAGEAMNSIRPSLFYRLCIFIFTFTVQPTVSVSLVQMECDITDGKDSLNGTMDI